MIINGIYSKSTKEILYSRSRNDFRESEDGNCFVDGGFDYFRMGGNFENFIEVELDPEILLKQILYYDWNYGNKNAENFKNGYCGRFKLSEKSSKSFYGKLITKGFEEVWKSHIGGMDEDGN